MIPRRISETDIPFHPSEILSHLREGDQSEAPLVESYLLEATSVIETIAQAAPSVGLFRLTIPRFPTGTHYSGPVPFTGRRSAGFSGTMSAEPATDAELALVGTNGIVLSMPPVKSLKSIQYYDVDGALQSLDTANLSISDDRPAVLYLKPGYSWPSVQSRHDGVTIEFWAGETEQLIWESGGSPEWSTSSGRALTNGDRIKLRVSGNRNDFLGPVATLPTGFTANKSYYVINADAAGQFNLSATENGDAINGVAPVDPEAYSIQGIYSGQMTGVMAAAVRKIASDSFASRCEEGSCSCSGKGEEHFRNDPTLQRIMYRSCLLT